MIPFQTPWPTWAELRLRHCLTPTSGIVERMTAYWISIYPEDIDQAKFAAYAKQSKPALEAAGGTFVARGLPELVHEDGKMTRVVVIELTSVDAARDAHDSAAYQQALVALDAGAARDLPHRTRGLTGQPPAATNRRSIGLCGSRQICAFI